MFLDGVIDQITINNVYPEDCAKECVTMTTSSCMSFNFDTSKKECSFMATNKDIIGGLSASVTMDYYQLREYVDRGELGWEGGRGKGEGEGGGGGGKGKGGIGIVFLPTEMPSSLISVI